MFHSLLTMASRKEAEADGMLVTHEGACGACSGFQDLSVYMLLPDLADTGATCGIRAFIDFNDGVECFKEIGFSEPCSAIWVYNTKQTGANCFTSCLAHSSSGLPNNEEAPGCELVECIQCDEDSSGVLFNKFAGRTRRRSGLLSKVVRPCTSISEVVHEDPCSFTPDAPEPTDSPTKDTASGQASTGVLLGILLGVVSVVVVHF
jgi:hypothetical protein